ncbi:hypothetical protein CYY_001296 [Polysphondylium violaceum]|uniref:NADH:flavin oxidoreductase/NADH oxidase N-terminal domain-containing protein n=1 Tax=Polysphondylium violaceum TaxID=133409 RepID=A0A8J4V4A3_9MYCE|nr:hypothetical protein CYY_001296 [Polysphondylium violaceum]
MVQQQQQSQQQEIIQHVYDKELPIQQFSYQHLREKPNPTYQHNGAVKQGEKVPLLFTPYKVKDLQLINRVVVPPLCMYSAVDGFMNDFHLIHLSSFAKGAAGLVIFEATAVCPEGRITYADAGLWKDDHIAPMKRIVKLVQGFGSKAGIQLAHAGRKAATIPMYLDSSKGELGKDDPNFWQAVGPSPISFSPENNFQVPHELNEKEIENVVHQFKMAASRCYEAGFDFIEIHGAHGYLISSFLSSTSNKRTDKYGGDFEGRSRLLVEIIKAIRTVWPTEKPLGLRLSCNEWLDESANGWTMKDTLRLAKLVKSLDVDLFDCSSGGNNIKQSIRVRKFYQTPFSEAVKKEVPELTVAAVGLITTGEEAELVLQKNQADLVMVGRGFMRNPQWTYQAAAELNTKIDFVLQYEPANRTFNFLKPEDD